MLTLRPVGLLVGLLLVTGAAAFGAGSCRAQRVMAEQIATHLSRVDRLQGDLDRALVFLRADVAPGAPAPTGAGLRASLIDQIKRELQLEMGLLPVRTVRARRAGFVELYSYDDHGASRYGTAGHLGDGYFITVKHAVIALPAASDPPDGRRITAIQLAVEGRRVPATVVDHGAARSEVDPGDWAIIKTTEPIDLPPLPVDLAYPFAFAAPIFRLGNDYSKGIIPATGYVGQEIENGLITCLTDGHLGASGGGILSQNGDLVGIPVGRMQGDFRFSVILPLRREMFRNVPSIRSPVTS